ncbi:hypothetical protein BFJ70_g17802 [Fusarium oxysporum]|nr:hypothetical protein BFJ70_g17802 [Fusarium oxysporum]
MKTPRQARREYNQDPARLQTYSITYLAHAHGSENGTGSQTALELNCEKNNAQGLLEIY